MIVEKLVLQLLDDDNDDLPTSFRGSPSAHL